MLTTPLTLPRGATSASRPAAVIVKTEAFDEMFPGLTTVTPAVPATAMSVAGIDAVNCVALSTVVVRSALFQRTTEPAPKFVPVTVSENAGPPATAIFGLIFVIVGAGCAAGCVTAVVV